MKKSQKIALMVIIVVALLLSLLFIAGPILLGMETMLKIYLVLLGVTFVGAIIAKVSDKKEERQMAVYKADFQKYVESHSLQYQEFSYLSPTKTPPTDEDHQVWIVTEKTHELVYFNETISPIPERYHFFSSAEKPGYILVMDEFRPHTYLLL